MRKMDMLHGSIGDKTVSFAILLAVTGICQQLFNAIDIIIMGRFVGKEAMAAVGSNAPVVGLLVTFFVGISLGANVVISQYTGQGNLEKVKKAVHTTIVFAVLAGILFAVLGVFSADSVVRLLQVPKEVETMSREYLETIFIAMPGILVYNFTSAIFRSQGDTRTPLMCLFAAGTCKACLSLFLVVYCGMDVVAVAASTVFATLMSSSLLLYLMKNTKSAIHISFHDMKVDWGILRQILSIGTPAGVQGAVFSLSYVVIQAAINSLGAEVMAASAAAFNLEILVYYIMNSFGQACTTFTGQNYGAGLLSRCRRVGKICTLQNLAATVASSMIVLAAGPYLLSVFSSDPEVIALGMIRLEFILIPEPLNMISEAVSGFLRAFGKSLAPAMAALVGICGTRILYVFTIFPTHQTFTWLMAVYPLSWLVAAAGILFVLYYYRKLYMGPDRV